MGLEKHTSNGLALAELQKNYSHTLGESLEVSVAKCCLQRGFLLPHSCEAWL